MLGRSRPQAFVVRAMQPAVCLQGHLLFKGSSLPFCSLQMCKCSLAASTSLQTPTILRGSFDQALWPQAFVVRASNPAVCLQSHLLLGRSSLLFASLQMPQLLRQLRPAFKPPKCFAAASTRHSAHRHLLFEPSSLPFASRAISLPFASLQMRKMLRGSFGLQTPKMLRGSFDQSLWPQAFVVRAIKPAACLQSHLFLGRSSLPFASLQMRKMLRGSSTSLQTSTILRGSFDQSLWPQVLLPFASLLLHSSFDQPSNPRPGTLATGMLLEPSSLPLASRALLFGRSSLPFASFQIRKMRKILRGSFDQPSNP